MKSPHAPQSELRQNLRWLINSRVIFTLLLLCSTAFIHFNRYDSAFKSPLILLYGMIAALFSLSMVYAFIRVRVSREVLFAYIQIAIDCLVVTVVIFVTGSIDSIFSFLYLVVIIYTSMLLYRRGSMIIAGVCSFRFPMRPEP